MPLNVGQSSRSASSADKLSVEWTSCLGQSVACGERRKGWIAFKSPVPLKKSRTRVELNSPLVILSLAVPQEPSTQSARTGLAREGENPWDTSSRKLRFERLYRAE